MEFLEMTKWVINRSQSYFLLRSKVYDKYMRDVIDNEIKMDFRSLKTYFFNPLRDLDIYPLDEDFFESNKEINSLEEAICVLISLQNDDFNFKHDAYFPGNYSYFSLYTSCSWQLNKEFRALHDQISEFLYVL